MVGLMADRKRLCALIGGIVLMASSASAQEPTLTTVLARAGAYVVEFERQLSGIVAEEQYVQHVRHPGATFVVGPERRELRSDLLLVKPAGSGDWLQFRDAFEVDGRSIRDRNERMVRLFLEPPASAAAQKAAILRESARYNIGTIERTVNTPVLSLMFLEPANQKRFKFRRTRDGRPVAAPETSASPGHFRVSTDVWVVQFEETQRGTMIRATHGRDLPSRGRFWIEPSTGRVLMSELVANNRVVRATIDVSYQSEPLLGLLVPIEMREWYEGSDRERIDGVATYGKFRQFQVNVDEKFLIKKPIER